MLRKNVILSLSTSGAMNHHTCGWTLATQDHSRSKKNQVIIKKKGFYNAFLFMLALYKCKLSQSDKVIIINGEYNPFLFFLIIYSRFTGAEVYLTWHDITPHIGSRMNYIYWAIASINATIANKIIVHSAAYVNKWPFKIKKILYLPLPRFKITTQYHASVKKNSVLFFGRIEKYKGVERIVNILKNPSLNSKKQVLFEIVGHGSKQYMKKLGIFNNSNVAYCGYVEDDVLAKKIMSCKAVLMPYIHCSQSMNPYWAEFYRVPLVISDAVNRAMKLSSYKGCYVFSNEAELISIINSLNELVPFSGLLAEVNTRYEHFFS
jgi:glycosyltransferase involved in cell wall biosynthesis